MGISPGKAVEIQGKCYTQLASLKQLFEESVTNEKELKEQKSYVLETLRKSSTILYPLQTIRWSNPGENTVYNSINIIYIALASLFLT